MLTFAEVRLCPVAVLDAAYALEESGAHHI